MSEKHTIMSMIAGQHEYLESNGTGSYSFMFINQVLSHRLQMEVLYNIVGIKYGQDFLPLMPMNEIANHSLKLKPTSTRFARL